MGDSSVEAEALLKWSMDLHAAMASFQATCSLAASDADVSSQIRSIYYLAPNRYKVVSTSSNQFEQTSVSDGLQLVEFGNRAEMPAVIAQAPSALHLASSVFMRHPMFCGSLLYQFFGGSANMDGLVQREKAPIQLEDDEGIDGDLCRVVRFYGPGSYGNVSAWIDAEIGVVRQITYDSEPQLERMRKGLDPELRKALQKRLEQLEPGPARDSIEKIVLEGFTPQSASNTTESYSQIHVDCRIDPDEFNAAVPVGRQIREIS